MEWKNEKFLNYIIFNYIQSNLIKLYENKNQITSDQIKTNKLKK